MAPGRLLLVVLACLVVARVSRTQDLLQGIIVSVTVYNTCVQIPSSVPFVNNTAFDLRNTSDSAGFSPCDMLKGTVTALRIQLFPLMAAGATNLQFTLRYLSPTADPTKFSVSNVCQGTSPGGVCQLLPTPMTITFDTTALFAAYSLTPRSYDVPFAYYLATSGATLDANTCPPNQFACSGYTSCNAGGSKFVSLGKLYQENGLFDLCPLQKDAAGLPGAKYYTGPNGLAIGKQNECSFISCRVPKNTPDSQSGRWSNIIQPMSPQCSVWDLEPNPSAIMNIRATITYGTVVKTLVLSTEQGNTIGAVDNLLFMQIIRTGFGAGVAASSLPGQIITCNACNPADPSCLSSQPFDDLPNTGPDGFTLYNPWSVSTDPTCSLPLAYCRQKFGGVPSQGFWYFNPIAQSATMAQGVCNSNGFWSYDALAGQGTNAAGLQNRICNSILNKTGTCIPGFVQPNQFLLPQTVSTTNSPCIVEQRFAGLVNCYKTQPSCNEGFQQLPVDYNRNPGLAQYYLHKGRLMRNALNTADRQGLVELILYIGQEFLGTLTNLVAGQFVEDTVRCGGTQNSEGSLAFQVQNLNLTTAGRFSVCATFTIPLNAFITQLTLFGPTSTVEGKTGDSATICQTLEVPAGGKQFSQFNYVYNGALGPNSLSAVLTLSATTASQQIDFSSVSTQCTTVVGISPQTGFLLYANQPELDPSSDQSDVCHWYNLFCFAGSLWQTIMKTIFWLLFFGLAIYATYFLVLYFLNARKLRAVVSQQRVNIEAANARQAPPVETQRATQPEPRVQATSEQQ